MTFRVLLSIAAVFATAAIAFSQVKKPDPTAEKVPFNKSLQAVIVTTPNWNSVQGKGRLFERKNPKSKWEIVGDEFPIVVGRNGLADDVSYYYVKARQFYPAQIGTHIADPPSELADIKSAKVEGDGKSPAGLFPLTSTFGNSNPNARLPFTRLEEFTECVDDTNSAVYNKIVNRMQVGNFDWKSSEKMLAVGPQYDLGVFVAYNSYPAIHGLGSCIFLHIWKDANTGTAGCTAMERENLERIVKWLDPTKNPYLVQMTESDYHSRRESLNLPKLK